MARDDTDLGGDAAGFPSTMWSAVLAARERSQPEFAPNLERLVSLYWKPVYWVIRKRFGKTNEEAKDLAQEFFASFLERDRLKNVGPEKGRFRTFVRVVLMNFLRNAEDAARARKRGGRVRTFSLSMDDDEDMPVEAGDASPDELLDRAWAWSVFRSATRELEEGYAASGKGVYFKVFQRHELEPDPPTYAVLAEEFHVSAHDVENYLKHSRSAFSKILRARVRETLSQDEDLESELRFLASCMRRR